MNAETREYLQRAVSDAKKAALPEHEARLGNAPSRRDYGATSNLGKRYKKPRTVCIQRRNDNGSYRITVPPIIAEQLPPALYVCELVEDGILYRRVDEADRRERAA